MAVLDALNWPVLKCPRLAGFEVSPEVGVEGFVEAVGEEAGLAARGAEDRLLSEGHALEGEQFLGVDRLVDGGEAGFQVGDLLEVFKPDDGEGGGGEAVSAGIAGGAGLAFGGARARALGGVGAIGGELFFSDMRASWSSSVSFYISEIARVGGESGIGRGQVAGSKGFISLDLT